MIVPESQYQRVKEMLDTNDLWDKVEVVLVQDMDYENALKVIESKVPEGVRVTEYKVSNEENKDENIE